MQIPYCVIDATTLVENIHEIKKWIYNGQIRLVVPLSTLERVEQLYQKSVEPKPKAQEPARPKSSGKTARKEHPIFDINPRLTRAFLGWLQRDKEHWDPEIPLAAEFQRANEVYTPWTLAEEQQEKHDESPEEGPATFAQAVAKSNLAKPAPGAVEASKAFMKPKLVARAPGSDRLPWKIGRKVPQIPLREVPVEVRPVLSYVLWRLHESDKGRADASFLMVLSDDPKTCAVGQKLDIVVSRIEEIRHTIAAQATETDRNTLGDLEREFGAREPHPKNLDEMDVTQSNGMHPLQVNGDGVLSGENVKVDFPDKAPNSIGEEKLIKEEDDSIKAQSEICVEGSTVVDKPVNGFVLEEAEIENEYRDLPKQNYPTAIDIAEEHAAQEKDGLIEPAGPMSDEFVSEKISNITAWIKNLAPKLSSISEPTLRPHQGIDHSSREERDPQQPQVPVIHQPVVLQRAAEISAPSPRRTSTASLPPAPSAEVPEDSDEEVVVFNPKSKRLSAQQKPPQTSPKQNVDLKLAQSPELNASQSPRQNVQRSPRKATPGRQPQVKTPPVAPAIIDPDAFGRSFATNPRAYARNNHPNSRYSPRGSPRRAMRTPEPELDYVLKSGNTRASVRGRGKLWVP